MKIKIGNSFPSPVRFISMIFSILGIVILFQIAIIGIIILLISSFIWSSSYGFEVGRSDQMYREYSSAFGKTWGKWEFLDNFPFMTILTLRDGVTVRSLSSASTTLVENYYGVYLLTDSHRTKVLVNRFTDLEKAKEFITPIALNLNKEVVQYDPVISERTRMRRNR